MISDVGCCVMEMERTESGRPGALTIRRHLGKQSSSDRACLLNILIFATFYFYFLGGERVQFISNVYMHLGKSGVGRGWVVAVGWGEGGLKGVVVHIQRLTYKSFL